MTLDPSTWTWRCMVCRKERPDRAISIQRRPFAGMEDDFPRSRVNLAYCNDDPACIEVATREGPWPEKGAT